MLLCLLVAALLVHQSTAQFDASGCGKTKGCFIPKDEICYGGCNGMGASYLVINDSYIDFEIFVNDPTGKGSYAALGFSLDQNMGHESVIECSQIGSEQLSMKFSYNEGADETSDGEPANVRITNEPLIRQTYMFNAVSSYTNGQLYCRALVRVDGFPRDPRIFTYDPNQEYYLLMANGPTSSTGLTHHIHDATSGETLLSQIFPGVDLSSCGVDKGCFIPDQCSNMDGLVATYKVLDDTHIRVELQAQNVDADSAYIAMAFSYDNMMGNDSVIECSHLVGQATTMKFSYNDPTPTNVRIAGENGIEASYFQNTEIDYANGILYCSATVDVSGSSISPEIFKYDKNQKYYILVAGGPTTATGLKAHTRKCASAGSTYLSNYKDEFDITECGNSKVCFIPQDADCTGGCNGVAVGYHVLSNDYMQIELTANSKAKEAWVAVGFSKDNMMGDDNVVECSALIGQDVSMKFSYNNKNPANERIDGDYSSYFSNVTAQFVDGILYCNGVVKVSGASDPRVFKYDPQQLYYLLLANGPTNADGLSPHQHTGVSSARLLSDPNAQPPKRLHFRRSVRAL